MSEQEWSTLHPDHQQRHLILDWSRDGRSLSLLTDRIRGWSTILLVSRLASGFVVGVFTYMPSSFSGRLQTSREAFLFVLPLHRPEFEKYKISATVALSLGGSYCLLLADSDLVVNWSQGSLEIVPLPFMAALDQSGDNEVHQIQDLEIWSFD